MGTPRRITNTKMRYAPRPVGPSQRRLPASGHSQPDVVRIVVDGTSYVPWKSENLTDAREILLEAFKAWPSELARFAVTPGGFIRFPLENYSGKTGWQSEPSDFKKLIPSAKKAIESIINRQVLKRAQKCARFLTLGVDLWRDEDEAHAEVVAIINVDEGKVIHWTGKSYPVEWQQKKIVYAPLRSHKFRVDGERLLVLGCHDLNMLICRGKPSVNGPSNKETRRDEMQKLAKEFEPTIILHHPHSTDSPNIWKSAWGACRALLPTVSKWTSGIAFHYWDRCGCYAQPRKTLSQVLDHTRSESVVDVIVKGYRFEDGRRMPCEMHSQP